MTGVPAGLHCPVCGQLAVFTLSGQQAFCGTDSCKVIMWDPTVSVEENMADVQVVDLSGQRAEPA